MIKFLYSFAIFGIIAYSTPVLAQQQINNNGANGGQLQQQVGGESIMQNRGAQQAKDITQNAGLQALQAIPNKPLVVTGAPSSETTTTNQNNATMWVLLALLLFAVLLGPAVAYLRAMQVAEQKAAQQPDTSELTINSTDDTAAANKATSGGDQTKAKNKPKKSAKKAKRKKSKR